MNSNDQVSNAIHFLLNPHLIIRRVKNVEGPDGDHFLYVPDDEKKNFNQDILTYKDLLNKNEKIDITVIQPNFKKRKIISTNDLIQQTYNIDEYIDLAYESLYYDSVGVVKFY